MADTIDDLLRICGGGNAPGVKKTIYYQSEENIVSIPAPDADSLIVSGDIVLETGKVWKRIQISANDQKLETDTIGDEDSNSKDTEFEFYLPGITEAKAHILSTNTGGCGIVFLFPDKEGKIRLIGDVDDAPGLKVKENVTGKRGYVISGKWSANHLPYFYEGAIGL